MILVPTQVFLSVKSVHTHLQVENIKTQHVVLEQPNKKEKRIYFDKINQPLLLNLLTGLSTTVLFGGLGTRPDKSLIRDLLKQLKQVDVFGFSDNTCVDLVTQKPVNLGDYKLMHQLDQLVLDSQMPTVYIVEYEKRQPDIRPRIVLMDLGMMHLNDKPWPLCQSMKQLIDISSQLVRPGSSGSLSLDCHLTSFLSDCLGGNSQFYVNIDLDPNHPSVDLRDMSYLLDFCHNLRSLTNRVQQPTIDSRLSLLENKCLLLQEAKRTMESQIAEMTHLLSQLDQKNHQLIEAKEMESKHYQHQLQLLKQEQQRDAQQVSFVQKIADLKTKRELAFQKELLRRKQVSLQLLERQMVNVEQKHQQLTQSLKKQLSVLKQENATLTSALETVESQKKQVDHELVQEREKSLSLEQSVQQKTTELKQMTNAHQDLDKKVTELSELKEKYQALKQEYRNLKEKHQKSKDQISDLQMQLETNDTNSNVLSKKIDDLDRERQVFQLEKQKLEQQVEFIKSTSLESSQRLEQLLVRTLSQPVVAVKEVVKETAREPVKETAAAVNEPVKETVKEKPKAQRKPRQKKQASSQESDLTAASTATDTPPPVLEETPPSPAVEETPPVAEDTTAIEAAEDKKKKKQGDKLKKTTSKSSVGSNDEEKENLKRRKKNQDPPQKKQKTDVFRLTIGSQVYRTRIVQERQE
ncbi:hypothetical protein EDD86DRAFT_246480 [Gorgonomyces haynaldii]|nr:hypothetical protein EDD86DRAFT_246480 [Gorgonomyces haynaldii]